MPVKRPCNLQYVICCHNGSNIGLNVSHDWLFTSYNWGMSKSNSPFFKTVCAAKTIWRIIFNTKASLGMKICSDTGICPWTLSVPWSSQSSWHNCLLLETDNVRGQISVEHIFVPNGGYWLIYNPWRLNQWKLLNCVIQWSSF